MPKQAYIKYKKLQYKQEMESQQIISSGKEYLFEWKRLN